MTTDARSDASIQRSYERSLREDVLLRFRDTDQFTREALARPTDADRARGITLISDAIQDFQRQLQERDAEPLNAPNDLAQRLLDEVMGMGPLQPLLDDPDIEEVMINGPDRVFVINTGSKQFRDDIAFQDEAQLGRIIERALNATGRYVNQASPLVDAQLPDGSRLNAVITPIAESPTITIRKFLLSDRSLQDLVRSGTISADAADYLTIAMRAGFNTLIFGGTGTGKTTFLNALGRQINSLDERVITIEETRELQITRLIPDSVALEARPAGLDDEGRTEVTVRHLVKNALRMRPTRIVVGEVRGPEALDMLLAMNSGHDGSMCTLHANTPLGALQKLRSYAMMAEEELPIEAINEMISEAIHIAIHLRQDHASKRRYVESIFEVSGLERSGGQSTFLGQNIFVQRGGELVWDGKPSIFRERLVQGLSMGSSEELGAGGSGPRRWM